MVAISTSPNRYQFSQSCNLLLLNTPAVGSAFPWLGSGLPKGLAQASPTCSKRSVTRLTVAWFTIEALGRLVTRHRADDTVAKAVNRVLEAEDDIGLLHDQLVEATAPRLVARRLANGHEPTKAYVRTRTGANKADLDTLRRLKR